MKKCIEMQKDKFIDDAIQQIGVDIGRGFLKAYSQFEGEVYQCMFKSIIGLGRKIKFDEYENPIYINVNNDKGSYFVGELAEYESHVKLPHTTDDKTGLIPETLMCACLSKVAQSGRVQIALGVPKKLYRRSVLNEVIKAYKDKTFKIKDKITNTTKTVYIDDITISREADSALIEQIEKNPKLLDCKVAMAVMGYKTTELAYYNEGFVFNDVKSQTIELGNMTMLKYVQTELQTGDESTRLDKSLAEIDSSNNFDDYKALGNLSLLHAFNTELKNAWLNLTDVVIFVAGGTLLNLKDFDEFNYELVDDDPQMAVARGLYLVAEKQFS